MRPYFDFDFRPTEAIAHPSPINAGDTVQITIPHNKQFNRVGTVIKSHYFGEVLDVQFTPNEVFMYRSDEVKQVSIDID